MCRRPRDAPRAMSHELAGVPVWPGWGVGDSQPGHSGHFRADFLNLFSVHFSRKSFRKTRYICPKCPVGSRHIRHIAGYFRDLFPVPFSRGSFRKRGTMCRKCRDGEREPDNFASGYGRFPHQPPLPKFPESIQPPTHRMGGSPADPLPPLSSGDPPSHP